MVVEIETAIHQEILKVKGVVYTVPIFGKYDLIVKLELADFREIGESSMDIRGIKGVIDTRTLTGYGKGFVRR